MIQSVYHVEEQIDVFVKRTSHGPEISGVENRRKEFMEKAEWHR